MTTACGYQQITVLSASVGLTVPTGATASGQQAPSYCIIKPEAQAVRWRDDGVAPTATVGYPLAVGVEMVYNGPLKNIRFIEQTAGGILNVTYYY